MNPRGPPDTPMDIETFHQNHQIKSMERTPLQSLTYLYKIMRKRSVIFFFFPFLFQTLRFLRKIGQSFLCFSDFPKFTKPAKTFKNTSNLSIFNFSTSVLGLLVHNPIKNKIYIYTFIHFNHQNISTFFNSMHLFLSKDWA